MSKGTILAGTVRMRADVQEAAQFTPVHLIHQFTKLADHPLTKRRGFPAPYFMTFCRVPDTVLPEPPRDACGSVLAEGYTASWAGVGALSFYSCYKCGRCFT